MHKSLKELVLESTDIVDVVGERVALTRKGKDFVGLCPFHNDHKPSMAVSQAKQIFKCWSCGTGGDAIKFVQLAQRVEFREALALLAQRAGISTEGDASADRKATAERESLRKAMAWARTHFRRNLMTATIGQSALEYARSRGFSDATLDRFGLGFAVDAWDDLLTTAARAGLPSATLTQCGLITTNEQDRTYDRFRNRLIFPIHDAQGRPIAFGGRTLGDDRAKYLNSPETPLFSKSRVLYAFDLARPAIQAARQAIVVEGYVDAAMLHQAGFENVVATLGTAMTDAHAKLLTPYADTIVMCFDGDAAGLKAADRAVEVALRHKVDVRVVIMPDETDPADCIISRGADGFKSLLQSALGALEFKWNGTVATFGGGSDPRTRQSAIEAFVDFIGRTSRAGGMGPLDLDLLIGRLQSLIGVTAGTVYDLLARAKAASRREVSVVTPDTSEESAYDASVQGLPAGMVSAVEELFGSALAAPAYTDGHDEGLSLAAVHCATWSRMLAIFRRHGDAVGVVNKAAVSEECEDAAMCELLSRSVACVQGRDAEIEDVWRAAYARLLSELELMRWGHLRSQSRQPDKSEEERERAFRLLLEVAGRQHGRGTDEEKAHVLGAAQRLQSSAGLSAV